MNDDSIECVGARNVTLSIKNEPITLNCLVLGILPGYDFLLSMDCVDGFRGAHITALG